MEVLHPQENKLSPDMLLEIADDFSQVKNELFVATGELAIEAAHEFDGQSDTGEVLGLQEKYALPFDPEKTIHGVGSAAIVVCVGLAPHEIERRALAASAGRNETATRVTMGSESHSKPQEREAMKRSNGLAYAQDQENYQPLAQQAANIVARYIRGDESALRNLSAEFSEQFKARVASHDGAIPDEEIDKIVSTVCIDLGRQQYGANFDSLNVKI